MYAGRREKETAKSRSRPVCVGRAVESPLPGRTDGKEADFMPRRGENIRKRKDGRWEGRYVSAAGGSRKMVSVYAKSYGLVRQKLAKAREEEQLRPAAQDGAAHRETDFRTAALEWLQYIRENRKYPTYVKYADIYKRYLSELDRVPLGELDVDRIPAQLTLLNSRESTSLKRSVYAVLNQIIRYCRQEYGIRLDGCAWDGERVKGKAAQVLNQTEQARLLNVLYTGMDTSKAGILLCLSTGLRLGEVCSLKWTDFDLGNRLLHVNSTVQRICMDGAATRTALYESQPKSGCSIREIPLPDEMVRVVKSIPSCGRYFLKGTGPMEPRTYQNRLKGYLAEAGIPARNFHALRHTFATNCIESGMDTKSLSEILGHAGVQITLNRYVHPSMDAKRQSMNNLLAVYGQIRGQGDV